jgi:hypothetical protein
MGSLWWFQYPTDTNKQQSLKYILYETIIWDLSFWTDLILLNNWSHYQRSHLVVPTVLSNEIFIIDFNAGSGSERINFKPQQQSISIHLGGKIFMWFNYLFITYLISYNEYEP